MLKIRFIFASVAFAQMLFYHRLEPSGNLDFSGSKYPIQADFDGPDVDMELVVPQIVSTSGMASKIETARF